MSTFKVKCQFLTQKRIKHIKKYIWLLWNLRSFIMNKLGNLSAFFGLNSQNEARPPFNRKNFLFLTVF